MTQISSDLPTRSASRPFVRRFLELVYKPFVELYLGRNRNYKYLGIKIIVRHGVFHPGLFLSTKSLLQFLQGESLKGKTFLEPGCGTGLLSVFAAKQGAKVTALDINKMAVQNTLENASLNEVSIHALESDLMSKLEPTPFDYIMINPPFYPRDPKNDSEQAWYCGSRFEYFQKLFHQLTSFYHEDGKIIMVLSEDCDIETISKIAQANDFHLELVKTDGNVLETIFLFRIKRKRNPANVPFQRSEK